MSLLPKSIHRCRRYPTKFNSGRDIPAIWALSFTRLEANRNLLTAMSVLPKSIHRRRRYPTNSTAAGTSPARWIATPINQEEPTLFLGRSVRTTTAVF